MSHISPNPLEMRYTKGTVMTDVLAAKHLVRKTEICSSPPLHRTQSGRVRDRRESCLSVFPMPHGITQRELADRGICTNLPFGTIRRVGREIAYSGKGINNDYC